MQVREIRYVSLECSEQEFREMRRLMTEGLSVVENVTSTTRAVAQALQIRIMPEQPEQPQESPASERPQRRARRRGPAQPETPEEPTS